MANLVLKRSDRYPVGTAVGAYPAGQRIKDGNPSGAPTETQTVAADGSLTFTTLLEGVPYVLWANVAGVPSYTAVRGSTPPAVFQTLKQRIAARRALVGA